MERFVSEHILARGEMYYYDGAVQDLEKTEHGYHAVVEGTEDYEVDIEMEDKQICEMYCTCPYAADGNNCKHMAAVLYEIEEQKAQIGWQKAPLVQSRRKKSWRKLLKKFRKRNCALL